MHRHRKPVIHRSRNQTRNGLNMNCYSAAIQLIADAAAILTSIIVIFGYSKYQYDKCLRRSKLEDYLKAEKSNGESSNRGQRSIMHLVAELGMSEDQIYEASFKSTRISRKTKVDQSTGLVSDILFEWKMPP